MQIFQEAIEATQEIANKCNLTIKLGNPTLQTLNLQEIS